MHSSRKAPGRSGRMIASSASRASPSSARSATNRSRSKFMLAPLSSATSVCPLTPSRSTHLRRPAVASAPAGSIDRARVVEDVLDGAARLVVGDADHLVHRLLRDRERPLPHLAHGDAVGKDAHVVEAHAAARLQRAVHRVGLERLDADHLHVGPQRLDVAGNAGDQPAAADRHEHRAQRVLAVAQDLGAHGALPGNHQRIVERVHEGHAGLGDQQVAVRLGVGVAVADRAPPSRPSPSPRPP